MGIAGRIKERRKVTSYTQTVLGEKLGLQASAIAKYSNEYLLIFIFGESHCFSE